MIASLFTGLARASQNWKMVLLLLAANILISLPIAVPVFWLITQTSSERQMATTMLADTLDPHWMADFINQRLPGESPAAVGGQIGFLLLVMGVSYLLLNTLFSGGILEVFASEDGRFTMRKFWAGCGAYFWRFFRLMLVSLLFYGMAYLIYFLVRKPIDSAAEQAAAYESYFYKNWAVIALLVLLFAFVNMVFDYAKIGAVIGDRRKMFRESFKAMRFGLRNFFRAYSLYWLIALISLGGFALLAWLRALVHQASGLAVFAAILLAHLAMAARMWGRLTFYAAELDLYRRLTPVVFIEPLVEPMEIEFATAEPAPAPFAQDNPPPESNGDAAESDSKPVDDQPK